jgi:hypothetical protein
MKNILKSLKPRGLKEADMSKNDTNKEAIAKAPAGRVRRTPVGRRNVLTVSGKDPDYVYRFVNDTGDNVHRFLQAGYEFVDSDGVTIGDTRIGAPSATGSNAEAHVGGGTKAFLMRQKQEYYEEDQAAKAAHNDAIEAATKEKALDGNYGKIDITRN